MTRGGVISAHALRFKKRPRWDPSQQRIRMRGHLEKPERRGEKPTTEHRGRHGDQTRTNAAAERRLCAPSATTLRSDGCVYGENLHHVVASKRRNPQRLHNRAEKLRVCSPPTGRDATRHRGRRPRPKRPPRWSAWRAQLFHTSGLPESGGPAQSLAGSKCCPQNLAFTTLVPTFDFRGRARARRCTRNLERSSRGS